MCGEAMAEVMCGELSATVEVELRPGTFKEPGL
jgi:hypothetical protein